METDHTLRATPREDPPSVLLVSARRWPLSARLAIALVQHGCAVSAICPPGHPLRFVRDVKEIYSYRRVGSMRSLEVALRRARPDIVAPCDDQPAQQLHELYRLRMDLRPLIERSLGDPEGYEVVESRAAVLEMARLVGIRVPATRAIESAAHAASSFGLDGLPAVLKLDGSCGGEGVRVVRSEREAADAFRELRRRKGLGTALKRLLIDRDPVALWEWRRSARRGITMEAFITGTPANIMAACWRGEILGQVSAQTLISQAPTEASTVVRVIDNEALRRAAAALAARLRISGFFGLDFILEDGSGVAHLIEMNPRATQLGHLALPGGDLAGRLYTKLTGKPCSTSVRPIAGDTIAFFPQAQQWGATVEYLSHIYHDVPSDQPRLVEYLSQAPWVERRWLTRIYRLFRRAHFDRAVKFETKDPAIAPRSDSST